MACLAARLSGTVGRAPRVAADLPRREPARRASLQSLRELWGEAREQRNAVRRLRETPESVTTVLTAVDPARDQAGS